MDAFDADVLIYASIPGHPLGAPVREVLERTGAPGAPHAIGSVLLIPEVLSRPLRSGDAKATNTLTELLARLDLLPFDHHTARVATHLAARYGLRAADAAHLATAAVAGADRFITNNRRAFPQTVDVVALTYPEDLTPFP
nr:PIN domain-containing protein [Actinomycetales bacterium]